MTGDPLGHSVLRNYSIFNIIQDIYKVSISNKTKNHLKVKNSIYFLFFLCHNQKSNSSYIHNQAYLKQTYI